MPSKQGNTRMSGNIGNFRNILISLTKIFYTYQSLKYFKTDKTPSFSLQTVKISDIFHKV